MQPAKDLRKVQECFGVKIELDLDLDRARDMFDRCIASGTSALIVKCADLLDNIGYVHLAPQNDQD